MGLRMLIWTTKLHKSTFSVAVSLNLYWVFATEWPVSHAATLHQLKKKNFIFGCKKRSLALQLLLRLEFNRLEFMLDMKISSYKNYYCSVYVWILDLDVFSVRGDACFDSVTVLRENLWHKISEHIQNSRWLNKWKTELCKLLNNPSRKIYL